MNLNPTDNYNNVISNDKLDYIVDFEQYGAYFELVNIQKEIMLAGNNNIILNLSELPVNIDKDQYSLIINGIKQSAPEKPSDKRYEVPLFKAWLLETLRNYLEFTDEQWKKLLFFSKARMSVKTQGIQYLDQIILAGFHYYFGKQTFDSTMGRSGLSILSNMNNAWTILKPKQMSELMTVYYQNCTKSKDHFEFFQLSLVIGFYMPDCINMLPYGIINSFNNDVKDKFFIDVKYNKSNEINLLNGYNIYKLYSKLKELENPVSVLYVSGNSQYKEKRTSPDKENQHQKTYRKDNEVSTRPTSTHRKDEHKDKEKKKRWRRRGKNVAKNADNDSSDNESSTNSKDSREDTSDDKESISNNSSDNEDSDNNSTDNQSLDSDHDSVDDRQLDSERSESEHEKESHYINNDYANKDISFCFNVEEITIHKDTNRTSKCKKIIVDTASSCHHVNDITLLTSIKSQNKTINLLKHQFQATKVGTLKIGPLIISNVAYVPDGNNVLGMGKLIEECALTWKGRNDEINFYKDNKLAFTAVSEGPYFCVKDEYIESQTPVTKLTVVTEQVANIILQNHIDLDHASYNTVIKYTERNDGIKLPFKRIKEIIKACKCKKDAPISTHMSHSKPLIQSNKIESTRNHDDNNVYHIQEISDEFLTEKDSNHTIDSNRKGEKVCKAFPIAFDASDVQKLHNQPHPTYMTKSNTTSKSISNMETNLKNLSICEIKSSTKSDSKIKSKGKSRIPISRNESNLRNKLVSKSNDFKYYHKRNGSKFSRINQNELKHLNSKKTLESCIDEQINRSMKSLMKKNASSVKEICTEKLNSKYFVNLLQNFNNVKLLAIIY